MFHQLVKNIINIFSTEQVVYVGIIWSFLTKKNLPAVARSRVNENGQSKPKFAGHKKETMVWKLKQNYRVNWSFSVGS